MPTDKANPLRSEEDRAALRAALESITKGLPDGRPDWLRSLLTR